MKKIYLSLLSLLFVFACASNAKYDKRLESWIGKPVNSLTAKWGEPSAKKFLANGDSVITYTKANDVYVPSEFYYYNQGFEPSEDVVYSPFLNDYDFSPYMNNFGYEVVDSCQTSFLIQEGLVTGWKWKGNDCISY